MGQHKHNPTAIAAAKGELPPKPKPIGKAEMMRILSGELNKQLAREGLLTDELIQTIIGGSPHRY